MEDEEFEKDLENLIGLLRSLQRINDVGRQKWLKAEIRILLNKMLRK